ncbi:MAG: CRTAC1 family protein [Planctomycetota bacterium]
MRLSAPIAGALVLAAGCGSESAAPANDGSAGDAAPAEGTPWFAEESEARGLVFAHESGASGELLMPEIMGGGAALVDVDADGDLDAYLVQSGGVRVAAAKRSPNRLFQNDGSGRFDDVTDGSGAGDRGYGMGVAAGDVDGDGLPELYVTNVGDNALLANLGEARFDDVTDSARAAAGGWSSSAAFLDADLDGDLDLFVVRYIVWDPDQELDCANDMGTPDYCSPTAYGAPALDLLLANRGDGVFDDASRRAGIDAVAANGLGIVCGDYDGDGWTDVFIANDQDPDLLWRNAGDGTFRDESYRAGCALDRDGQAKAGMGVAAADVDEDGDEDLLVCNLSRESDSYFENRGEHFVDRTTQLGLRQRSRAFTRFGVGFADFDQDGRLDLFQANGRVLRRYPSYAEADEYAEPNLVLRGTADGRLVEVLPPGGTSENVAATSRAAAFGDVDGDGAVDVLVVNRDARAHLLVNRVEERGAWIGLRVLAASGADALHAVVDVRAGPRQLRREVRAAASYLASSSPLLHIGLGALEEVDEVRVRWPDGTEQRFGPLTAGRVHELRRAD